MKYVTTFRIRRLIARAVLAVLSIQGALVGTLVVLDYLRKLRRRPPPDFDWREYPELALETSEDRVRLFAYGTELYTEMLKDIERARETIFLETFILKGDDIGRKLVDTLDRKAREGVQVYVVFDWFANLVVPPSFKRFPNTIHTLVFRRMSNPGGLLNPRNYVRDHRKQLVIDGRVAYVGGFNIGKFYARWWRDTQIRIDGPAVREMENTFADLWNANRSDDLPSIVPDRGRDWNPTIIVHRNDPYMRIFPIRGMYLEAIDRSEKCVRLTHAYFIPDRALRAALKEAVRRGVEVQILLPWNSNHVVADWLARRFFSELLRAGVRIFAYRGMMIHSKTATIDGVWSTVGTANMDRLSLLGNYELNVEIYSARLADQMERMFELDKHNACELTPEEWEKRSMVSKFVERMLESLAPLV